MYISGSWLLVASSPTTSRARSSAAASTPRSRTHARGGGRDHARATGTSTSAPVKSPSHQVRQTFATWSGSTTSPASCASEPIVALTAVPAASAPSIPITPPMLRSGGPLRATRRSSIAAISTSSRFPQVWTSAVPTGSVP